MRILVTGCRWFYDDDPDFDALDFQQKMEAAGGNTGNLFIGEAVRFHLRRVLPDLEDLDFVSMNNLMTADADALKALDDRYDMIVISAANMLNQSMDFGALADALDHTSLPVIIIGIGAQAAEFGDPVEVAEGTVRLVQMAADRSHAISVRGPFTADVLARYGVHNVTVTGCPSMYLRTGESFEISVPTRAQALKGGTVLHMMRDRSEYDVHKPLRSFQVRAFNHAIRHQLTYIVQTNYAEAWTAYHRKFAPKSLRNLVLFSGRSDEARKQVMQTFLLERTHIHFKYAPWRAMVAAHRFSYGARFHGNMMALMAGTPALWVCHDTRTRELCELLHLPYVDIADSAVQDFNFPALIEKTDYSDFTKHYGEACRRFDAFLADVLPTANIS